MLEQKYFNGGLNSDDEDRVLPNGDYRYALNVRNGNTDQGSMGAIENSKGNTLISNVGLPVGTNRVIGSFDDILNNKVYYFVYNSNNDHSIFEFNPVGNVIETIFTSSLLDFRSDTIILSPQILGGNLYFTDNETDPKCINIERGRNFFQNAIVGVENNSFATPVTIQDILLIKYPPEYPPYNVYESNQDIDYNNLTGKLFQFKAKYVYYGNQESAWSSISKIPLPLRTDIDSSLAQVVKNNINNQIKVDVNSGSPLVKSIKIAVREVGGDNADVVGDFVLWKEIQTRNDNTSLTPTDDNGTTIAPNTDLSFNFLNDAVHLPIVESEPDRLFDNVPYKAKDMALLNGSRLGLFNIEDGNDNLDEVSIKTQVQYNSNISTPSTFTLTTADNESVITNLSGTKVFGDNVTYSLTYTPTPTQIIRIKVNLTDRRLLNYTPTTSVPVSNKSVEHFFEYDGSLSINQILNNIASQLNVLYSSGNGSTFSGAYTSFYSPSLTPLNNTSITFSVIGNTISAQYVLETPPNSAGVAVYDYNSLIFQIEANSFYNTGVSFKRGANHNLGMVYSDNGGRLSTVQLDTSGSGLSTIEDSTFFVDWYNKTPGFEGDVDLKVFIGHKPPEWATNWQFVMSKNQSVSDFIQFKSFEVKTDSSIGDGVYRVKLTNLLNYGTNVNAEINYSFSRGDRLRFIKDKTENYFTEYFESEIIKEEIVGSDHYIFIRALDLTNSSYNLADLTFSVTTPNASSLGCTFEIYTPNKSVDKFLYYEVGEKHPVLNPGTTNALHGFNQDASSINVYQDQTSTLTAIAELKDIGDVYYKSRLQSGNDVFINELVESYRFSDFYNSFSWNSGRPNIEDVDYARTRRETTARYSEPYVPATNIDGISSFLDLSFEEYDWQYGSIQKVHPENGQIICFQELKVGRILISESVLYDSDGNINAIVGSEDNQVLNPKMQYYAGEYGIAKNPESFAVYGNSKYFTDALRGVVLRLGMDGITPISNYKMGIFFEDKLDRLNKTGKNFNIFGTYDKDFSEYVLAFEEVKDDLGNVLEEAETITFNEDKNRWSSYWSYKPEMMVSSGISLVTFVDGELYLHNSNSVYNNFYATQYNSEITLISNVEPQSVKFYKTISTDSTDVFTAEEITNQFGQLSNLANKTDWELREGVYRASFLRDINSGGSFSFPLLEGDNLRSHSLVIKLINDSINFQKLFLVSVRSERSMLTNY